MCLDGNNGMRSGMWWLPALAVTLVLCCVAAPLRAEKPSYLSYLPGAGSLPENVVISQAYENTFTGDKWSKVANAVRVYRYLYGGDLEASNKSGKIISLAVQLELYNSEGAPGLAAYRKRANADGPPEIRRRFPQVISCYSGDSGYTVTAIQGRFALGVQFIIYQQSPSAEVRQKADSLCIWLLAETLKKLPGSPEANPSTAPAVTRESLTQRYAALREQHAELLESRLQVIAYRDKVEKIYHYNVLKITLAFVVTNLKPPASMSDLAEAGINTLLEQAGLSSSAQGDMEKVEMQRRLLKLVRSLDQYEKQLDQQAAAVRAEMAAILPHLMKLP